MAWPKGRRRKAAAAHGGKLMIVLRNRHTVWIDMTPEQWPAARVAILEGVATGAAMTTIGDDTVRVEDIVHVKYIGPKAILKDASPETGSGAEAAQ